MLPAAVRRATGGGVTWHAAALATARRHWLVSVLLAAGLTLRLLAQIAYQPALIYVDTLKYLYGASPGSEPLGYTAVLKTILLGGGLGTVAAVQHLLGLAMAVVLYALLARRGVPRWLAAVAVAPVLLDAYQLQMEQTIMPDVWLEAMLVAGAAVLLWRPAVSVPAAVLAGLVLGASATLKQQGEVLVLPAVVYLLLAGGEWRSRVRAAVALVVAFGLPILGYCTLSYARTGHFWLAHGQSTTGRIVAAADCATLRLPPDVRALCPSPAQQARGPDWLEHSGQSPLYSAPLPPGTTTKRYKLIGELDSAVMTQQPLRVAVSVASDWLRLFYPTRSATTWVTPISRWQFQAGYPTYPPWISVCPPGALPPARCLAQQHQAQQRVAPVTGLLVRPGGTIVIGVQRQLFGRFSAQVLSPSFGGQARVNRPVAAFLRAYQLDGGYTPGPLLALFAVAALGGSLLALSRRGRAAGTSGLALACLLFTCCAVLVLMLSDVFEFSWRYQLPGLVTLPPAGALGIAALLRQRRGKHLVVAAGPGPQAGSEAPGQAGGEQTAVG